MLLCPALYESRERALAVIERAPPLQRVSLRSLRLARVVCEVSCMLRPLLRHAAPLFDRDIPAAAARAGLDHTWPSYSRTLDRIVPGGVGSRLIGEVGERVAIVHAKADSTVPLPVLEPITPLVGRFALIDGDHLALLRQPESVAREVIASVPASG